MSADKHRKSAQNEYRKENEAQVMQIHIRKEGKHICVHETPGLGYRYIVAHFAETGLNSLSGKVFEQDMSSAEADPNVLAGSFPSGGGANPHQVPIWER